MSVLSLHLTDLSSVTPSFFKQFLYLTSKICTLLVFILPTGSSFCFFRFSSFSWHLNVGGLGSSGLGFLFNYTYTPLQGNLLQTHCFNRGFANLYLQLQGSSQAFTLESQTNMACCLPDISPSVYPKFLVCPKSNS